MKVPAWLKGLDAGHKITVETAAEISGRGSKKFWNLYHGEYWMPIERTCDCFGFFGTTVNAGDFRVWLASDPPELKAPPEGERKHAESRGFLVCP